MMHRGNWQITELETLEALTHELLHGQSELLSRAYRVGHLLALNDSTEPCPTRVTEYAILDARTGLQVESLTVSWMDEDQLASCLRRCRDEYIKGEETPSFPTQVDLTFSPDGQTVRAKATEKGGKRDLKS